MTTCILQIKELTKSNMTGYIIYVAVFSPKGTAMGSMIVPMEPINHVIDGNDDDPPSSRATRHRRPKLLNMAAAPLMKKVHAELNYLYNLLLHIVLA
jgi:hypothetical protein